MIRKRKPSTKKKNTPSPQKRKGLVLQIGLIFFVSIWMFILGVFVGRGTAPVQFDIEELQKELAALKGPFEQFVPKHVAEALRKVIPCG